MEEFNFNLLRISIIQTIKSAGFDKCKNSTVNIVTDLYVQVFELLLSKALKYGNGTISSMDILQAMIEIGIIKVSMNDLIQSPTTTSAVLATTTGTNNDRYNTKSVDGFKNWMDSINQITLRKVNEVPTNYKQIVWENRKDDGPNTGNNVNVIRGFEAEDGDDNLEEINSMKLSWLNYLIEKDNKFGKDKFTGSYFNEEITGEYLTNESKFNEYLPINFNYDDDVTGDQI